MTFQPTLPARGATRMNTATAFEQMAFQPTLPARGATLQADSFLPTWQYFNPRSPHGERQHMHLWCIQGEDFNPRSPHGERPVPPSISRYHAGNFNPRSPHGERQAAGGFLWARQSDFNPRSPHGERPRGRVRALPHFRISTHAPRTGSDNVAMGYLKPTVDFNPRSPHGERRVLPK